MTSARITRLISPASGAKWFTGVLSKIRKLERDPHVWPLADEAADVGFELRMMLYGRGRHVYRILFEIHGTNVIATASATPRRMPSPKMISEITHAR
jgi:hypothetical protein